MDLQRKKLISNSGHGGYGSSDRPQLQGYTKKSKLKYVSVRPTAYDADCIAFNLVDGPTV